MDDSIAHSNGVRTVSLFRLVGYGLLVLALFDLVELLVPLRLLDPAWEIQTIGALVERVPVLLLGLVLVFYGGADFRPEWERNLVKFLSRAALVMGALFLLLAPLLVLDTLRLQDRLDVQLSAQVSQRQSQLAQLETKVNQTTEEQLDRVLDRLPPERLANVKTPQEVKQQMLAQLTQAKKTTRSQVEASVQQSRFNLMKKVTKWFFGALVAGFLLISIALRYSKIYYARQYKYS